MRRGGVFDITTYRSFWREAGRFLFWRLPGYFGSLLLFGVLWLVLSNALGDGLGMSNLFRDRPDVQGLVPGAYWNSPTLWTSAFIAFSACLVMAFPAFEPYLENYHGKIEPDGITYRNSWIFFGVGVIVCYAALAYGWSRADHSPPVEGERLRAALGIPIGLCAFALAFAISELLRFFLDRRLQAELQALRAEQQADQYDDLLRNSLRENPRVTGRRIYERQHRIQRKVLMRTILLKLAFAGPMLAVMLFFFFAGSLIAAIAMLVLILSVFLILKIVWILPPVGRIAVFVLLGVYVGLGYDATGEGRNGFAFKHGFDGILDPEGKDHYADPVDLSQFDPATPPPESCGPQGRAPESVDFARALRAWKGFQAERHGVEKPKLVIVATSGGAYRASFWTGLVLDQLVRENNSKDLRGIADGIRFITGASGGMVGAAYFTAAASREPRLTSTPGIVAAMQEDIMRAQQSGTGRDRPHYYPTRYPVPRDSLSGVAQHLLQRDLRAIFRSGFAPVDRGKVLENHWLRIARPFADFAAGEREGWRPSIILSPMLIETGQPLIVSNLDMGFLPEVQNDEAVEMFALFPCAANSFRLNTAVRMNASFPLISPANSLPTSPRRRVVDAGYYDNYGLALVNALISQSSANCTASTLAKVRGAERRPFCFREWVREETSGIVLIEIRAFGISTEGEVGAACEENGTEADAPSALEFLTSPVDAVLSARSRSMVFRNEQGRRRIRQFDPDLDLRRVVFAHCKDGAMNWILPPDDYDELERAFQGQWALQRGRLAEIWNDR